LQVGDGTTNGSLASPTITNNASLVFSRSDLIDINTAISGAGSLTANAGTGEIGFRGSVSAGSVAATSTFASSAQALFGSSYAAAINLFANIATTGNQTYTGVVSIGRGSGNPTTVLTTTGGGNVTLSGGVVSGVANYWSAGTLTIDTSAGSGNVTLAGMTLSYGVGNLNIKSGTGTITLTGGNYYYDYSVFNGNVALTGNAIFQPANQWVRGVTINGDLTGGYTLTASLGNGAASTTGTGVAGLLFSNTTAHTVSCVIAGSSGLTKNGAGTLSLTGANTYSGATTISAGKLQVNGSLAASSAVTVSAAGTLGGTGTVNGTVTLSGAIAPGASVGTLSTGAETWNGGASYACEINSTNASGCDRLNITGALNVQATAGAPFTVKLASLTAGNTPGPLGSFNKFRNYTWTIATASGGVQNFATNSFALDTSSFSNDFSGGAFSLAVAGNNLVVNYKAAPSVPPWFSAIASLGSGGMQLGGTGGVGQVYVLLSATNLAPSVWIPIATNTANANGVFQFTDPQATNYVERFYRAVSP
jgi:autotransporter-associated beta strand protein